MVSSAVIRQTILCKQVCKSLYTTWIITSIRRRSSSLMTLKTVSSRNTIFLAVITTVLLSKYVITCLFIVLAVAVIDIVIFCTLLSNKVIHRKIYIQENVLYFTPVRAVHIKNKHK